MKQGNKEASTETGTKADASSASEAPRRSGFPIPEGVTHLSFAPGITIPRLHAPLFQPDRQGCFVAVRPVGDQYGGKTWLGILLGDIAMRVTGRIDGDTMVFERAGLGNPCIYVPGLNQFVYGMESWWGILSSPEDLKQITDADIGNVWYVQALKALSESEQPASSEPAP